MTEQQQADDLARQLDEALTPDRIPGATEDNPLVATALQLANAPHPRLSSDAMSRIRAQVIQAAEQQKPAPKPVRRPLRIPRVMRWAAAACFALALAGGIITPVTASSVPGDVLYPVKQAVESVETALATSPESQMYTYLSHAERRTQELTVLVDRGQFDPNLVTDATNDMTLASEAAGRAPVTSITARVQARSAEVFTLMAQTLQTAESSGTAPENALASLQTGLMAAQQASIILLQPTEIVAQNPTPTATFTPTASFTPTYTSTPTYTETATVTVTPSVTATATVTQTPTLTVTPSQVPEETETSAAVADQETATMTATPTVTATPEPEIAYVNTVRGANLRSGPGMSFQVVAVVGWASQVEILDTNEDKTWAHIRVGENFEGWMSTTLLQDTRPTSSSTATSSDCQLPGRACEAPGHTGEQGTSNNGQSGNSPGNSGSAPGRSDNPPPGQGGTPPGQNK